MVGVEILKGRLRSLRSPDLLIFYHGEKFGVLSAMFVNTFKKSEGLKKKFSSKNLFSISMQRVGVKHCSLIFEGKRYIKTKVLYIIHNSMDMPLSY